MWPNPQFLELLIHTKQDKTKYQYKQHQKYVVWRSNLFDLKQSYIK